MPRKLTDAPADRFASRVRVDENGCWLWTGAVSVCGYGKLKWPDVPERGAHRASWHVHRGPIADGLSVCHVCDVPLCVNPDHLFLGTAKDNALDAARKGRFRFTPEHRARLRAGRKRYKDRVGLIGLAALSPEERRRITSLGGKASRRGPSRVTTEKGNRHGLCAE